VSAEREGLGKHLLSANLSGGGRYLMVSKAGIDISAQPVHTGNGEVLVMRHAGTVGDKLSHKGLLKNKVTCKFKIMLVTPIKDLLHKVSREEIGDQLPELDSDGLIVANLSEEARKNGAKILAVSFLILVDKSQAPRNTVSGDLRLVGEEAVEGGAVLFIVGLIYLVDKVLDNESVKGINVEGVNFIVEAEVAALADDSVRLDVASVGILGERAEILLPISLALAVDLAAAKAGGPAVFIVCPSVHTAFVTFFDTSAYILKPLLTHILGLKTAAGVHKVAADTNVIHKSGLTEGLGHVQFLVPRPKGHGTVLFVNILEIHTLKLLFSGLFFFLGTKISAIFAIKFII
jgi:hypothetical protein